jgi:hypothetical protein
MAANLEDVPSLDLMHELLRRMKCSSKPDKRLILIGTEDAPPLSAPNSLFAGVKAPPPPPPRRPPNPSRRQPLLAVAGGTCRGSPGGSHGWRRRGLLPFRLVPCTRSGRGTMHGCHAGAARWMSCGGPAWPCAVRAGGGAPVAGLVEAIGGSG